MFSHWRTGNLWSFARDRRVAAWAKASEVTWTELQQSAVTRGRARGEHWAQHRARFLAEPVAIVRPICANVKPEPNVASETTTKIAIQALPSAAQLGLADVTHPAQRGGASGCSDS
jgi:deoxyribodipyrimidine photo-lyase